MGARAPPTRHRKTSKGCFQAGDLPKGEPGWGRVGTPLRTPPLAWPAGSAAATWRGERAITSMGGNDPVGRAPLKERAILRENLSGVKQREQARGQPGPPESPPPAGGPVACPPFADNQSKPWRVPAPLLSGFAVTTAGGAGLWAGLRGGKERGDLGPPRWRAARGFAATSSIPSGGGCDVVLFPRHRYESRAAARGEPLPSGASGAPH